MAACTTPDVCYFDPAIVSLVATQSPFLACLLVGCLADYSRTTSIGLTLRAIEPEWKRAVPILS